MKEMKSPILITGCARSGTSLIAGIINMCGAFGGDMSGPNRNNQKGMFENFQIRNNIVKPYFRELKVDPLGQYPLPNVGNIKIPTDLKSKVDGVINSQGYTDGPWMYKGAKMCLTWPAWHYAYPNAKWIIVRRRTGDIATSCLKTGFMRAFARPENIRAIGAKDEREAWVWWVNQHLNRFREMQDEGLNVKVIWPHRMVTGDYSQIYEMLEWLGLEWKSEILSFIDPKLWHARKNKEE